MRFITVSSLALTSIVASAELMSSLPTGMCSDSAALGNWISSYTQMAESHYKSLYENSNGSQSATMATAVSSNASNPGLGVDGAHQDEHVDDHSNSMHSGDMGTSMDHMMTSASSAPSSTESNLFEGKGTNGSPVLLGVLLASIPVMMLSF